MGMGIGIASMCIPVYMAETSPVELRGFLGASFQVDPCLILFLGTVNQKHFLGDDLLRPSGCCNCRCSLWRGDRLSPFTPSSSILFSQVDNGWKYDFGLAGIPSVILLVGFFFCPESPR